MDTLSSLIMYLVLVYFGGFVVKLAVQSFKEGKYFGFGLYLFNTLAAATALIENIVNN